jgi:hypothetical protein
MVYMILERGTVERILICFRKNEKWTRYEKRIVWKMSWRKLTPKALVWRIDPKLISLEHYESKFERTSRSKHSTLEIEYWSWK